MSKTVDIERAVMSVEFRHERAKRIRRQMDDVVRLWLEGLSVTLIAQRLNVKRDRVYFILRALELKSGRVKALWRHGHLYGLRVPAIDENTHGTLHSLTEPKRFGRG